MTVSIAHDLWFWVVLEHQGDESFLVEAVDNLADAATDPSELDDPDLDLRLVHGRRLGFWSKMTETSIRQSDGSYRLPPESADGKKIPEAKRLELLFWLEPDVEDQGMVWL